jgi:translocation and assembly module TamA
MDVTFSVDPGPKAGFGEVSINGPNSFDPSIVRSFIYVQPGQPYTPKARKREVAASAASKPVEPVS